jgi:hypothetical protein
MAARHLPVAAASLTALDPGCDDAHGRWSSASHTRSPTCPHSPPADSVIAFIDRVRHVPKEGYDRTGGNEDGEIRQVGVQKRQVGHASKKEGHSQERIRSKGEESQTSNCYRTERSKKEGSKSSEPEVLIEQEAVEL